jgi:hypothetical protein
MTRLALTLCLPLTALLLACSGDDDEEEPTPSPTSDEPDAAQMLSDASQAVANLKTFHFVLTQEEGIIPIPPNFDLESAEGNVVLPDSLEAELETDFQGINVNVDAIAIGGDTWITNPFTRSWQQLNVDLRDYADLAALIPALLPAIQEPRIVGETELDGVPVVQIEGVANSTDLQDALAFSLPDREVMVEVWLGADDSLPRRVRVIGQLISGESPNSVRQVDLSRLNEPVEISPP